MFVRAHFAPLDSRSFGSHGQDTGQQFQMSPILKNTVCRDVTLGSLLEIHCHVGGALYLPRKNEGIGFHRTHGSLLSIVH